MVRIATGPRVKAGTNIVTIDMVNFTPFASLIGGAMIGLAAVLLMLVNGRVMGVSGILGGIIRPQGEGDVSWRLLFVGGMIIGPFIVWMVGGTPIEVTPVASGIWLHVAALLVGIGTAIGAGCTSGHGICGLARLSMRSLVAVMTFMISAIIMVYLVRHVFA